MAYIKRAISEILKDRVKTSKSEILKSYSNEGMDYRFNIFYYRGKDRSASNEEEQE